MAARKARQEHDRREYKCFSFLFSFSFSRSRFIGWNGAFVLNGEQQRKSPRFSITRLKKKEKKGRKKRSSKKGTSSNVNQAFQIVANTKTQHKDITMSESDVLMMCDEELLAAAMRGVHHLRDLDDEQLAHCLRQQSKEMLIMLATMLKQYRIAALVDDTSGDRNAAPAAAALSAYAGTRASTACTSEN